MSKYLQALLPSAADLYSLRPDHLSGLIGGVLVVARSGMFSSAVVTPSGQVNIFVSEDFCILIHKLTKIVCSRIEAQQEAPSVRRLSTADAMRAARRVAEAYCKGKLHKGKSFPVSRLSQKQTAYAANLLALAEMYVIASELARGVVEILNSDTSSYRNLAEGYIRGVDVKEEASSFSHFLVTDVVIDLMAVDILAGAISGADSLDLAFSAIDLLWSFKYELTNFGLVRSITKDKAKAAETLAKIKHRMLVVRAHIDQKRSTGLAHIGIGLAGVIHMLLTSPIEESDEDLVLTAQYSDALEHVIRTQGTTLKTWIAAQEAMTARLKNAPVAEQAQRALEMAQSDSPAPEAYETNIIESIAQAVDAACHVLGFDLRNGVVPTVWPVRGLSATSSDFFGTGIAIVGIEASLIPFTGMLADLIVESCACLQEAANLSAKLVVRSCFDKITGGKSLLECSDAAMQGHEMLIHKWERFFLHFAGFSMPWNRPKLSGRQEAIKFELTSAMEVFVVAHEYGHHVRQHNSGENASTFVPSEEARQHEFEADRVSWTVSKFLGANGFAGKQTDARNYWMESSAGVVAYLTAADVVSRVRSILEEGRVVARRSASHPNTRDRLRALELWSGFDKESLRDEFRLRRRFLRSLIGSLYLFLKPKYMAAHKAGFRQYHL